MNLKEVLLQLNSRVLEQLFQGPSWKNGNPENIADQFLKDIPKLWKKLNGDEQKVLIYFLFCRPGQLISYRQMDQLAKSHSPYAIYRGLTGLRQKGIVYTRKSGFGEQFFFIPEDVGTSFRSLLWQSYVCIGSEISVVEGEEELPVLCDVLFQLLQTYRHQPIALTKKGTLPARISRIWHELIPYPDELFVPFHCSKVEWFFFFLKEMGLMAFYEKKGEKMIVVDEEKAALLFQGTRCKVQKRIYEGLKKIFIQSHPFYQVIFEGLEKNQGKESWKNIVQQVGFQPDEREWDSFTHEVFPLLQVFGCLLMDEEEPEWLEKSGYVQPTMEVIIMPVASYDIRWELGKYAKLVSQQELWTFQLEQQLVTRIKETDRKNKLISLLKKIHRDSVPENVVKQLQRWIEATEDVIVEKATLLRCSSKRLADRLESARIKGLEDRINDTLFLVSTSSLSSLQKELNKIEIRLQEQEEEEMIPLSSEDKKDIEETLEVESVYPELEDLLPQIKEIPSLWRKNRQKYHPSTLRMFMEQVSTLGLPIYMEARKREWEGIYIRHLMQEQGLDMVYFTDGCKEYSVPLMEIGPIQIQI